MVRLLSLTMAVVYLSTGAFFAAMSIWLLVASARSEVGIFLYSGLPILLGGVLAGFFFLVGRACLMTARVGKDEAAVPDEAFE